MRPSILEQIIVVSTADAHHRTLCLLNSHRLRSEPCLGVESGDGPDAVGGAVFAEMFDGVQAEFRRQVQSGGFTSCWKRVFVNPD
jgi:hypothetical protein